MTTATITTTIANWDREDHAAATMVIQRENTRRSALPTPLPALPLSTAAERRTSYQTIMAATLQSLHLASVQATAVNSPTVKQIREAALVATDAQRAAALAALTQ